MEIEPLESRNIRARWDPEAKVAHVTYHYTLNPEITAQAYQWMLANAPKVGLENVRGSIFDFTAVERFAVGNLQAVRDESRKARTQVDLSSFPTALIVETDYQEKMVKLSTQLVGDSPRIRLVRSHAEAIAFIDEWHASKSSDETPATPE